ncbi:MAG: hypothetical protein HY255_09730 [Betaproteobacteria bacterium]|nr:hypothetical protein [Betaproteobacteria bacterium]
MKQLLILASLIALPAAAGPYDQVYSIVSAEFTKSADYKLQPVILNRIDDDSTTRRQGAIAPGHHTIYADLPASKEHHQRIATQNSLAIDFKPCVRYYIAAKLTDSVTRHWQLVIRDSETIGECAAKYLKSTEAGTAK